MIAWNGLRKSHLLTSDLRPVVTMREELLEIGHRRRNVASDGRRKTDQICRFWCPCAYRFFFSILLISPRMIALMALVMARRTPVIRLLVTLPVTLDFAALSASLACFAASFSARS